MKKVFISVLFTAILSLLSLALFSQVNRATYLNDIDATIYTNSTHQIKATADNALRKEEANSTLFFSDSGVKYLTPHTGWSLTGNSGTTAGTNFVGTSDSVDFVSKTNGIERMRILAHGGKIGIGTSTPAQALDVNGSIQIEKNGSFINFNNYYNAYFNLNGHTSFHLSRDSYNNRIIYMNDSLVIPNFVQLVTNAGAGKVLTSDANGLGSWQTPGGTLPSLNSVLHSGDSTGGKSIVVSSGDSLKFKTTGVPGTHIFSIANSNAFTSNFSWKLPFAQGGVNTFLNNDGGGNLSWTSPPVASSGTYTPTYANAFNITGSVSGNLFYAITPSGADTMVRVWGYVVVNHITTTNLYSGFTFTLPIEAHNFITNCGAGFANQLQSTTFSTGTVYVNVGAKTAEADWNSQVPVSAQNLLINFTYMLNK